MTMDQLALVLVLGGQTDRRPALRWEPNPTCQLMCLLLFSFFLCCLFSTLSKSHSARRAARAHVVRSFRSFVFIRTRTFSLYLPPRTGTRSLPFQSPSLFFPHTLAANRCPTHALLIDCANKTNNVSLDLQAKFKLEATLSSLFPFSLSLAFLIHIPPIAHCTVLLSSLQTSATQKTLGESRPPQPHPQPQLTAL